MSEMSESTAVDLVLEIITLNAKITDLTSAIEQLTAIIQTDLSRPEPSVDTPAELPEEVEVAVETESTKKKYFFFGDEKFNPKVPMPKCFGREYDSPACIKVKDKCGWNDLCSQIPKCFVRGYGSDECLSKIESCDNAERCGNLHSQENPGTDHRTERIRELGMEIKQIRDA